MFVCLCVCVLCFVLPQLKAMLVTNTGAQVELPTVHLPFEALFGEDGLLPQADYIGRYKTYTEANTVRGTV